MELGATIPQGFHGYVTLWKIIKISETVLVSDRELERIEWTDKKRSFLLLYRFCPNFKT